MSKCVFTINFPGSAENVFAKMKPAIEGQGGKFQGDASGGRFSVEVMGTIAGSYAISGQAMTIDIESKPMFIPCSQIESFMRRQFGV